MHQEQSIGLLKTAQGRMYVEYSQYFDPTRICYTAKVRTETDWGRPGLCVRARPDDTHHRDIRESVERLVELLLNGWELSSWGSSAR